MSSLPPRDEHQSCRERERNLRVALLETSRLLRAIDRSSKDSLWRISPGARELVVRVVVQLVSNELLLQDKHPRIDPE